MCVGRPRVRRKERDQLQPQRLGARWHPEKESAGRIDCNARAHGLQQLAGRIIGQRLLHRRQQLRHAQMPSYGDLVQDQR